MPKAVKPTEPAMQVVVLVGGKGTRLREITREIPKPLVPVAGDRRFLDYLLEEIGRQGFRDIVLVAGHLGEQVRDRYHRTHIAGAEVRVIVEREARGTAGALLEARDWLDHAFLVMNGDAFLDINLRAFERAAAALDEPFALGVLHIGDVQRYGTVEFAGSRVSAFREKDATRAGAGTINSGVYRLSPDILGYIRQQPSSLETDVFPALTERGLLGAVPLRGWFIDIGLPETLAQARQELPVRSRRPAAFLDRDGTLNVDNGYTHRVEDLAWQPGATEAVRMLNDHGFRVIVCTNQAGVAKGHFSETDVLGFHAAMQRELAEKGAFIDAFYYCPYHIDAVSEAYRVDHPDRKPQPGMLLRAMTEWAIDKDRSFMIGDHDRDVRAGVAAGVPAFLYEGGPLDQFVRRIISRGTEAGSG